MAFESIESIVGICVSENKSFAKVVCEADCYRNGHSEEEEKNRMLLMWKAMLDSAMSYDKNLMSSSKLTGGDGGKFCDYAAKGDTLCGDFSAKVIAVALKVAESNACMKRIVAAPTAGSCGVLPAVLVPLFNEGKFCENDIVDALFVAAGIGQVIANRASIAGASGGCQAEVGAASAMAAGMLVFLKGGNAHQIGAAVGFALQNLMGLVCDPVAGLVEVPCVKRNVIGALNAISCADMALAGINPKIPCDEVIDAMKEVGDKMDVSLKETGKGGLAATPTAKKLSE